MNASLRRRLAIGFGVLALTGTASAVANPAYAAGSTPWTGALCTATENIQFYNYYYHDDYVVEAGEFIRVDEFTEASEFGGEAKGHGERHSTRYFVWSHFDGSSTTSRLKDCHNT